jgi:hypothetical protein
MRRSDSKFQFAVQSSRIGDPPPLPTPSTRGSGDLVPDAVNPTVAANDAFSLSLVATPDGSVVPVSHSATSAAAVTSSVTVVASHTINSFGYQSKSDIDAAARQRLLATLSQTFSSLAEAIRSLIPKIFGPRRDDAISPVGPSQASPAPGRDSPPRQAAPATQPAGTGVVPPREAKVRAQVAPAIEDGKRSQARPQDKCGAAQALAGLALGGCGVVRFSTPRQDRRARARGRARRRRGGI